MIKVEGLLQSSVMAPSHPDPDLLGCANPPLIIQSESIWKQNITKFYLFHGQKVSVV
jgi:hypothetical protein